MKLIKIIAIEIFLLNIRLQQYCANDLENVVKISKGEEE